MFFYADLQEILLCCFFGGVYHQGDEWNMVLVQEQI